MGGGVARRRGASNRSRLGATIRKTPLGIIALLLVSVLALPTRAPAAPSAATPRNYGIMTTPMFGIGETAPTDLGIDCDDCTKEIALPFSVNIYGTNYTTAVVSSNGNVQFTTN